MVEWKDETSLEESGKKAYELDNFTDFRVPNFFVVTRTEIEENVDFKNGSIKVSNELKESIRDNYDDIGVSSEVRNASGKAKNLVEGQRQSQRVSIRLSGAKGEYFLEVGSSDLIKTFKDVLKSAEIEGDRLPGVIFQKMVEPGFSGAAVQNYNGNYTLVEIVKGSGESLERGITTPETHLIKNRDVLSSRTPDEQVIITRNKMNGNHQRKIERLNESLIKESDLIRLKSKLDNTNKGVKFVYKRGSFHIIDVFDSENNSNPFNSKNPGLKGIRVSKGHIEGVTGRDIKLSDEAVPPPNKPVIARKGGYTSRAAEKAREKEIPAIFNFQSGLEEGKRLTIPENSVEITNNQERRSKNVRDQKDVYEENTSNSLISATEVLALNRSDGICTRPPFSNAKYAVTDQNVSVEKIPREGLINSYERFFSADTEKIVVDSRRLSKEGLEKALEYLEVDFKVLIIDSIDSNLVESAVRNSFDVIASDDNLDELQEEVLRQEKKFMLEKLRNI